MANVIGQRVRRQEDERFLTGEGRYVDNLRVPRELHVTFVRSHLAHARIAGIDASAAKELPNTQVFTASDVDLGTNPLPPLGIDNAMERPFLASDTVRFVGDIVACVLTDSAALGVDAAELVDVDYDDLPVVIDPRQAASAETLLFPSVGSNVCLHSPPK
jgi:carbon-monoxide dehydrogenase large subunit